MKLERDWNHFEFISCMRSWLIQSVSCLRILIGIFCLRRLLTLFPTLLIMVCQHVLCFPLLFILCLCNLEYSPKSVVPAVYPFEHFQGFSFLSFPPFVHVIPLINHLSQSSKKMKKDLDVHYFVMMVRLSRLLSTWVRTLLTWTRLSCMLSGLVWSVQCLRILIESFLKEIIAFVQHLISHDLSTCFCYRNDRSRNSCQHYSFPRCDG